jgi:MFS family permease
LAGAQLLSAIGDGISLIAVTFALIETTGSAYALGLVLGARYVTLGALLMFGGVLGDRVDRRVLMVRSDLVRGFSQAALAGMLFTGHFHLWLLVPAQIVYGAGEAFSLPAARSVVPQTVPVHCLRAANAILETGFSASRVIGPAIGGLIVIVTGASGGIALDAATFMASAVLVLRLRVRPVAVGPHAPMLAELRDGWLVVCRQRWLWVSILTFTVAGALTVPAVFVLGPLASWQGLGGEGGWAVLTSSFGAGAVLGGYLGMRVGPAMPGVVLMFALTLAAARPATFVLGWSLPTVAACSFIGGAGMTVAAVVWETILQTRLPQSMLARVCAIDDFGTYLLTPIGYFGAAPLAAHLGLTSTLVLLAVVPVAVCALALCVPELRGLSQQIQPVAGP